MSKLESNIKEEILQGEMPQIPHQEEIPQLQNLVQSDDIMGLILKYLTLDAKDLVRAANKDFKKLVEKDIKKSINIIPQIKSAFGETEADFRKIIEDAYNHPLVAPLENAILQKHEVLPLADRINNLTQGLLAQGTEKKALLAGFVIDYVHSISTVWERSTLENPLSDNPDEDKNATPDPINLNLNPNTNITYEKHQNWQKQRFFAEKLEVFDRKTLEELAAHPNKVAAINSIKSESFNDLAPYMNYFTKEDFVIFVRDFMSLDSNFLSRPYGELKGWSRKKSLSIKNISHYRDYEAYGLEKATKKNREFEPKEDSEAQIYEELYKEKAAKLAEAQERLPFMREEQAKLISANRNRANQKGHLSQEDRRSSVKKMKKLHEQEFFYKLIVKNTPQKLSWLDFNKVKLSAKIESNLQDINEYNEYNKKVSARTTIKYFKQQLLAQQIQEDLIQKDAGKDLDKISLTLLLINYPECIVQTIDEIKAELTCNIAEAIDVFSKAIIGAILSIKKYDTMKKVASRVLGKELDTEALKPILKNKYKEIIKKQLDDTSKNVGKSPNEERKKIEEKAQELEQIMQELEQIDYKETDEEKYFQKIAQSAQNSYYVPRTSPEQADRIKAMLRLEIDARLDPASDLGKQYSNVDFDEYEDLAAIHEALRAATGEALDPDQIHS